MSGRAAGLTAHGARSELARLCRLLESDRTPRAARAGILARVAALRAVAATGEAPPPDGRGVR